MSRTTWIDFSSEWFARTILGEDVHAVDAPFSDKQTQLLQELLTASFTKFAEELGRVLGTRLSELRLEFTQLRNSTIDEEEVYTTSRGADATVMQRATSHGKSGSRRTIQRRLRRKRTKATTLYQRSLLLQLRPSSEIGNVPCMPDDNQVDFRLSTLEAAVFPSVHQIASYEDNYTAESWQSCVSAQALEQECRAVRFIQLWWRHRRHMRFQMVQRKFNAITADRLAKQCDALTAARHSRPSTEVTSLPLLEPCGSSIQPRRPPTIWFYAVHGGTCPGIYESYTQATQHAKEHGALLKKFPQLEEAEKFVARGLKA